MSRAEIKKKFDAIVDFSGVEKFLDTPVKRYSSGMYVRLAFSVAAHLEPEILIVDEVLAVGDAEFQKKCLGKMEEVSKNEGRTVLFVSHQMGLIAQLCNRAMLMDKGFLQQEGKTDEIIGLYNSVSVTKKSYTASRVDKDIFFEKIEIQDQHGNSCHVFGHDESIHIYMRIRCKIPGQSVQATVALLDNLQQRLFTIHIPVTDLKRSGDVYEGTIRLQENLIAPRTYNFLFDLFIPHQVVFDQLTGEFSVKISDRGSKMAGFESASYGFYFIDYKIIS